MITIVFARAQVAVLLDVRTYLTILVRIDTFIAMCNTV